MEQPARLRASIPSPTPRPAQAPGRSARAITFPPPPSVRRCPYCGSDRVWVYVAPYAIQIEYQCLDCRQPIQRWNRGDKDWKQLYQGPGKQPELPPYLPHLRKCPHCGTGEQGIGLFDAQWDCIGLDLDERKARWVCTQVCIKCSRSLAVWTERDGWQQIM